MPTQKDFNKDFPGEATPATKPELTPADAHRILTNLAAQHALEQASAAAAAPKAESDAVIARYVGNGYYILPGLPGRDLTEADFAGSGWDLERALSVRPPVYEAAGSRLPAGKTTQVNSSASPDAPKE